MTLAQTMLDELWDFADATGSEARLRAAFDAAPDPVERRELRTQVARALGLQERFTEGHGCSTRSTSTSRWLPCGPR